MGDPEAANLLGKFDFVHARLVSGGVSYQSKALGGTDIYNYVIRLVITMHLSPGPLV